MSSAAFWRYSARMATSSSDRAAAGRIPAAHPSLSALAAEIRDSGILGRAYLMNRLFDCLLERSVKGEAIKEIELARTVFDQNANAELAQNGSVRVYIYRLRRKLDAYYQGQAEGPRLTIPKGEYRLIVDDAPAVDAPGRKEWNDLLLPRHKMLLAAVIVLSVLVGAAAGGGAALWFGRPAAPPASRTGFWRFLGANGRPTFIVIGDYYAFGLKARGGPGLQAVDPAIHSDAELEQFMAGHPGEARDYTAMDLHYLPTSAAFAVRDLMPIVDRSIAESGGKTGIARVTLLSDLTPDAMKGANIIYIGAIDGLGKLEDMILAQSRFRVDGVRDMLIDSRSMTQVPMSTLPVGKDRMARQYAYIATFEGPSSSRFVVIAGSGDAATKQAAATMSDQAQIARMQKAASDNPNFEALWQVNTLNNVSYSTTLLSSSSLSIRKERPGDG
jgi:hypothetical protein